MPLPGRVPNVLAACGLSALPDRAVEREPGDMTATSAARSDDRNHPSPDPRITTMMTSRAVAVGSTRAAAAHAMLTSGSDAVPVLEDGRVLGIVTATDLATSLIAHPVGGGSSGG
jgi:CBS domain-containing protein